MRATKTHYDIVGDLHGQGKKLHAMLATLGYRHARGAYRHPLGRMALFVGDLIDRGPEQVDVVQTVRDMVEAGTAQCVLGNHEFNAIGYATRRDGGEGEQAYLHTHTEKHTHQHAEYLKQVKEGSALHRSHIAWFRTLPVALDLGALRVVHAWWHQLYVDELARLMPAGQPMTNAFVQAAFTKGTRERLVMEGLTKGLELKVPVGSKFTDDEGGRRGKLRIKWWEKGANNYREAFIAPAGTWINADVIENSVPDKLWIGKEDKHAVPLFIGHYWLTGHPAALTPMIACLDYSVAKQGPLVAYRWSGEATLDSENFLSV